MVTNSNWALSQLQYLIKDLCLRDDSNGLGSHYLRALALGVKILMSTSEVEASSSGLLTRVQNFLSENKKAVIIGTTTAVIAIGGAAYYASSSRTARDEDIDSEKGEKKKDKKKYKGKKKKAVKDKDGPLLEERKPKTSDSNTSGK